MVFNGWLFELLFELCCFDDGNVYKNSYIPINYVIKI